jgi:uncharacterized coiled-coil DUF342 family protein
MELKDIIDELHELRAASLEHRDRDAEILAEVRQLADRVSEIRGELKNYQNRMAKLDELLADK